jgi:diacylglycerol O-acyltransferase
MPPEPHHERLSALDATFLAIEDGASHMHIGSVGVFEPDPDAGPGGALDLGRIARLVSAALDGVPRYRQRIATSPILGHPVWVDDASFDLDYHLRHTRLPFPGDERQLKRLAGRVMSQQLDRRKPLWESWFVEGLEGNRFAVVSKVHHCMVDGVGGVELTTATMRTDPDPDPRLAEEPRPFVPRPAPTPRDLLRAELRHRLGGVAGFAAAAARGLARPRETVATVAGTVGGFVDSLVKTIRPASPTPLNVGIGPHRRFDWTAMNLDAVKAVKSRLGGTVNDVVLAIVAGAMRRYLGARGVDVDRLDFRAMVPVNLRAGYAGAGNRVGSVVARLPVDEPSALGRFMRVRYEMEAVKRSHQVEAVQAVESIVDWAVPSLIAQMTRLAGTSQPFNVVVTNVPGPQFPLYFLGARLLAAYPFVPIFRGEALGIALFSYDGRLYWGIDADRDAVPGVHDLVTAIDAEIACLEQATGVAPVARTGAAA